MKKLIALLAAGTMMLGVTANALVLEQDFFNYNHMLVDANAWSGHAMTASDANSDAAISHEASIVDGQVVFSGVDASIYGNPKVMLSKVFATTEVTPSEEEGGEDVVTTTYNDKGTGKTVISFDAMSKGTNGWTNDYTGSKLMTLYTGEEGDYTKLFDIKIGFRPYDMRIDSDNSKRLSTYHGKACITTTGLNNIAFELDHDTETVTLFINGEEATGSTPYTFDTAMLKDTPITKLTLKYCNNTAAGVGIIDNLKVVNTATVEEEEVVTTLLDENFNDTTKKYLRDFGLADGLDYFYRTDNALGIINDGASKKGFVVEKGIDTLPATGKVVVDFSLNAYDAEGNNTSWIGLYGTAGNDKPIFAMGNRTSATVYEKVVGFTAFNSGTREQAKYVNFFGAEGEESSNGIKSATTVANGTEWDVINDIRLVLDMDAKTYNVYYKDATDEYVIFNETEDIPFADGDVGTINKIWIAADGNGSNVCRYELSDLKIYSLASDKPTPVVYEGTTVKTDIEVGDAVTVYAPMYADYEYATLIMAAYNDQNQMVSCKVKDYPTQMVGYQLLKDTFTMPAGAETLKVFFWDGLYEFIPYSTPAELTAPVVEEVPAE